MAKIKSLTNEENKPPASHPVSSYKFKEIKWSPKKNTIHKAKAIKTEIKVERKLKRVVRSRDVVIDKKSKKYNFKRKNFYEKKMNIRRR